MIRYQIIKTKVCKPGYHTPANKSTGPTYSPTYIFTDINKTFNEFNYKLKETYSDCGCQIEIKELQDEQKPYPGTDE